MTVILLSELQLVLRMTCSPVIMTLQAEIITCMLSFQTKPSLIKL